jgi:hypothetical protein
MVARQARTFPITSGFARVPQLPFVGEEDLKTYRSMYSWPSWVENTLYQLNMRLCLHHEMGRINQYQDLGFYR